MGSNSVDQNNHHEAIEVFQLDRRRLDSLHQKLSTQPSLLSQSAGRVTCSIFRVPQTFIDHNGQALYYPDVVSIGPFHRGKPHLQIIQERKYQYLAQLLSRTKLSLEDLFNSLQHLQEKARESYSETILLDAHDFVELMVVDGCFVLELFRKVAKLVRFANDDPIASMSWIFSFLLRDLLRLENQLPFFVLQKLFEVSRSEEERNGPSLQTLILTFFSYAVQKLDDVTEKFHNQQLRMNFVAYQNFRK
ncbi:hypothetical protein Nepgr_028172 [Nepenthes gracilis]|uniref:Uncharacterized protein n=1 Tax=Nepenthes gracilis TaxID=150966 RepID=A0AAD3TCB8_NEPGR|nr:hypothetical protein Nepgr_028172 [Nepenthes gracilis]